MRNKTFSDKSIKVGIIYNAFDPSVIERDELVYRRNTKLKTYLAGLPTDCDWKIGVNGIPVDLETDGNRRLRANDSIQLVVVPRGGGSGGGGKNILRMVAILAITVAATALTAGASAPLASAWLFGSTAASSAFAVGAATIAGSLLVNAILPPTKSAPSTTSTYGYDGASNTAKEGAALPVVYGKFRVAGNYVDMYTENVGDLQYLYARTVLSDGPIKSVSDFLIDHQDVSVYRDVDYSYSLGTPSTPVPSYFNKTTVDVQVNEQLIGFSTSPWTYYTTSNPVDQIQLNLTFPSGIFHNSKKGTRGYREAVFDVQYSVKGANNWRNLGTSQIITTAGVLSGATPSTDKLQVVVEPILSGDGFAVPYEYQIQYRLHGASAWTTYRDVKAYSTSQAYVLNDNSNIDWSTADPITSIKYQQVINEATYEWTVPQGTYEIQIVGQGTMVSWGYRVASGGQLTYVFTDNRSCAIRKTIESGMLDLGLYDVRIRKTNPDGNQDGDTSQENPDPTSQDTSSGATDTDVSYFSSVGEITTGGVALNNVACAWYKILMSAQLSGVPNLTCLVEGVLVNQYDPYGNVVTKDWSDNPAWIVLDMLIGEERGSPGMYTIDFPAFYEWAQFCTANNLTYNGVIDQTTTLWDACVSVLQIGHAAFTRVGTKMSVSIDGPTDPVMLFGPGNIFKDTFKIDYMAITDRANEFEVSYYDATDYNKQKTLRIVDPDAVNRGDLPKAVSYSLIGVDNYDQAQREAWYQLFNNRYLRRTVTFDAPIESIALGLGDIALVQHDMMNWGISGRLSYGSSTTTINLDRPVIMEAGKNYNLMVIHNTITVATSSDIHGNGSNIITLDNLSSGTFTTEQCKRLVAASGNDYEIVYVNINSYNSSTGYSATFHLDRTFNETGVISIVNTDVIEEMPCVFNGSSSTVVTVSTPFTTAPEAYANFMFGDVTYYKKPYRLKSITGTGFDRRTLMFVEYNDAIYNPPEDIVPFPPTAQPQTVGQVTNLAFVYDYRAVDVNTSINGTISWSLPNNSLNYGGADIYVARNGSAYTFSKSVLNVNSAELAVNIGEDVSIKVVAFSNTLIRAPFGSAPYVTATIQSGGVFVSPPTNLTISTVSYIANGIVKASWTAATDADPGYKYRVQIQKSGTAEWDEYGVTSETSLNIGDLNATSYTLRVRSEFGAGVSIWVQSGFSVATIAGQTVEPGATVGGVVGSNIYNPDGSLYVPSSGGGGGDFTPPDVPTGLNYTSTFDSSGATILQLTWNAVSAADLAYYDLQVATNGGNFVSVATPVTNGYIIHGLAPNTTFAAKVQAIDNSGNQSGYSTELDGTVAKDSVAPAAPTNLSSTSSYSNIFFQWQNPADTDLQAIQLRVSSTNDPTTSIGGGKVNAVPNATGRYTYPVDPASGAMYYWVLAIDTSGNVSGYSNGISAAPAGITNADVTPSLIIPKSSISSLSDSGIEGQISSYNGRAVKYTGGVWTYVVTDNTNIVGQLTSDQISSIVAAKVTGVLSTFNIPGVDASKIISGTFDTNFLADASVKASKIADGAVNINKLTVGSAANLILGSDQTQPVVRFVGIEYNPDSRPVTLTKSNDVLTDGSYSLADSSTIALHETQAYVAGSGGYTDISYRSALDFSGALSTIIPIDTSKVYEASAYAQSHRCNSIIMIVYYASDRISIVGSVQSPSFIYASSNGKTLDTYYRAWTGPSVPPSNAAFAQVRLRKFYTNNDGSADSWLFVTRPFFGESVPNATSPQPWTPGGLTYIDGNNLITDTVTARQIATGTITANEIAARTIVATNIATGTLTATEIATNTITATNIAGGTITADKIAGNTITGDKIQGNTITGANIFGNTITGDKIQASAITAANISAGAITASKLGVLGESLFPDPQVQDRNWWFTNPTGHNQGYTTPDTNYGNNGALGWQLATSFTDGPVRVGSQGVWQLWDGAGYTSNVNGNGGEQVVCPMLPIAANTYYELSAGIFNASNRTLNFNVQYWDSGSNYINGETKISVAAGDLGSGSSRKVQFHTPSNCGFIRIYWETVGSGNFAGYLNVGNINFREAGTGTLIVDGTLSATKIATKSITADQIQTGSLTGDLISASTSLPSTLTISNNGFQLGTIAAATAAGNIGAANRIKFSEFGNGSVTTGWYINDNQTGSAFALGVNSSNGVNQLYVNAAQASAAGQTISICQDFATGSPSDPNTKLYQFNCVPGELIAVQAMVSMTNAQTWHLHIAWTDVNGLISNGIGETNVQAGTGNGNGLAGNIIQVPAGAVSGSMILRTVSAAAGTMTINFWHPMVSAASPGQTAMPAYVAGSPNNPASIINANSTQILPGKILISGATTLSNWIYGGDNTSINGGAVAANTITANKLTVGNRNIQLLGITFSNDGNNTISWTSGYVDWFDENFNRQVTAISAGSCSRVSQGGNVSGVAYVWFGRADTSGTFGGGESTPGAIMSNPNRVIVASYFGGNAMNSNYGQTIIDGSGIRANSITADRLSVTSLSAISATIGSLRTATTGARMELHDNVIKVYDSNNVLRVQIGDLTL